MHLIKYITDNWDQLPKSLFNDDEIVIFHCTTDENYGWGHHSYDGYGVDKEGKIVWCFSSGCSCTGSCGTDHVSDYKTLTLKNIEEFDNLIPEDIDFHLLQVNFSDY